MKNNRALASLIYKEKISNINDIIPFLNLLYEEFDMKFEDTKISINEIAKAANCSWDTANKHINGKLKGYSDKRPSKVDKVRDIIEVNLNDANVKINSITAFYRFLKREYPELVDFKVGAFKYYVNKYYKDQFKESRAKSFTTTFETEPGEQAQFDFKEKFKVILETGEKITFDVAVMQMAFSRNIYRKIIPNKTTEVVIDFMLEAFEYFGGVPKELVIDNAKCLVISHNAKTSEVAYQPQFESFAKDMGFSIYPCKPYRPETKGKVEATMKPVDELEIYNGKFNSVAGVQEKLDLITYEFNDTSHSTTKQKPNMMLKIEKEQMLPLPQNSICSNYRINYTINKKVIKTGVINYDSTNYSVPYKYIGTEVQAYINREYIHIYYNKILIASHKLTKELNSITMAHVHPSVRRTKQDIDEKTSNEHEKDEIQAASQSNLDKLGGLGNV